MARLPIIQTESPSSKFIAILNALFPLSVSEWQEKVEMEVVKSAPGTSCCQASLGGQQDTARDEKLLSYLQDAITGSSYSAQECFNSLGLKGLHSRSSYRCLDESCIFIRLSSLLRLSHSHPKWAILLRTRISIGVQFLSDVLRVCLDQSVTVAVEEDTLIQSLLHSHSEIILWPFEALAKSGKSINEKNQYPTDLIMTHAALSCLKVHLKCPGSWILNQGFSQFPCSAFVLTQFLICSSNSIAATCIEVFEYCAEQIGREPQFTKVEDDFAFVVCQNIFAFLIEGLKSEFLNTQIFDLMCKISPDAIYQCRQEFESVFPLILKIMLQSGAMGGHAEIILQCCLDVLAHLRSCMTEKQKTQINLALGECYQAKLAYCLRHPSCERAFISLLAIRKLACLFGKRLEAHLRCAVELLKKTLVIQGIPIKDTSSSGASALVDQPELALLISVIAESRSTEKGLRKILPYLLHLYLASVPHIQDSSADQSIFDIISQFPVHLTRDFKVFRAILDIYQTLLRANGPIWDGSTRARIRDHWIELFVDDRISPIHVDRILDLLLNLSALQDHKDPLVLSTLIKFKLNDLDWGIRHSVLGFVLKYCERLGGEDILNRVWSGDEGFAEYVSLFHQDSSSFVQCELLKLLVWICKLRLDDGKRAFTLIGHAIMDSESLVRRQGLITLAEVTLLYGPEIAVMRIPDLMHLVEDVDFEVRVQLCKTLGIWLAESLALFDSVGGMHIFIRLAKDPSRAVRHALAAEISTKGTDDGMLNKGLWREQINLQLLADFSDPDSLYQEVIDVDVSMLRDIMGSDGHVANHLACYDC